MGFQKIGVLGSGIMGGGIAEVAAATGATVIARSRSHATADAMLATIEKSLAKQVDKGKRTPEDADDIIARVSATTHMGDLADCDFIIESVIEDLDVKRGVFRELNDVVKPDAIIATNTSTLSVIELAMETSHPDRVCGLHFFNPAPAMSLVEVVRPICASDDTRLHHGRQHHQGPTLWLRVRPCENRRRAECEDPAGTPVAAVVRHHFFEHRDVGWHPPGRLEKLDRKSVV